MAAQLANAFVILVLCCFELGFSQSSKHVSDSDYFASMEDYYSDSDIEAVQFQDSPQETAGTMKSKPSVDCLNDSFKVILPSGSPSLVKVLGYAVLDSVLEAPNYCGYSLTEDQDYNVLLINYKGCHVTLKDGRYTVKILYPNKAGQLDVATLSCNANISPADSQKQFRMQSDQARTCAKLPPAADPFPQQTPSFDNMVPLSSKPGGCSVSFGQRVMCNSSVISSDECLANGCCFDGMTSSCYYPMDECTADMNFVFAVKNDFANIPVNPMSLMVAGNAGCKPVISNNDFAVFKFSVTECGTRSFVIGDTIIYLAEVQSIVRVRNLKYGMISRDNPIRLVVECRYPKDSSTSVLTRPVLASAGYMVMSPSLPPYLLSEGLFGVQLLIAEDVSFTKFYPRCHQPLSVLLGKSVYLELRLKSPKPEATLIVHYCVAYPRSARSALVLLFDGCPNPLDTDNTAVLYTQDLPQSRHRRRFEIKAFQFIDVSTNKYLNEEIYFMCSTEVCMPNGSPCAETCFDGKSR
ncbi:zona pellucida sperm-binding protein 1-like [Paramisgurnus dabryanus]|uniref:zona pellucida sperm-binding protein 1-like n=1 Tax=Paramisgurnus dabryanus TaxID=90735 RepID=UPI0031F41B85